MKATQGGSDTAQDRADRIDDILDAADTSYEEVDSLPSRDKLTFTNGFYANCSAIFIDLRNSSKLPDKHRRPTLAKIYRSFISEAVAVINGARNCSEVNIQGDAVWGVLDTPYKSDVDAAFEAAGLLNSIVDLLNCRFKAAGIDESIQAGIGLDYGRALMIKAGHKGSSINDVVWMGDVVNSAAKFAGYGSKTWMDSPIMLSSFLFQNLKDEYQKLCSWNGTRGCYESNAVNIAHREWIAENCRG